MRTPFSLVFNGSPVPHDGPDPAVPWWSFTKTVLSAAALSLVRDGRVGLDDALPEGPFTLRQLLRHEAGLADYGELPDYHAAVARGDTPWPAEDMVRRLDAARLRDAPGTGWRYSNVGYMHVAGMIERLSGLPLEQALMRRALAPLGVSRARLARTHADLAGVDMGAASAYDPRWVYHGLLVGPLSDAARFLAQLLAGQLLPAALMHEMRTARALGGPLPGRPWVAPGYALGLMQGTMDNGLSVCGHTGAGPGSVVAVYHGAQGGDAAACAVFHEGGDEGAAEAQALAGLAAVLKPGQPDA